MVEFNPKGSKQISIHALREEGDHPGGVGLLRGQNFYPRPPRGGRPPVAASTFKALLISIHALREEGDPRYIPTLSVDSVFLSTPSARRATSPGAGPRG